MNTNSKPTSGPWMSDSSDTYSIVAPSAGGRIIAEIHGENHEASARLIAAAPEMLEALKTSLGEILASDRWDDQNDVTCMRVDRLRALIARVEGGDE
jgi:hypothetical protein